MTSRLKGLASAIATICLLVTVWLAGAVWFPSTAYATPNSGATGQTGCGNFNITANYDSTETLYYFRSGLQTTYSSAVQWVMVNRINPTDLNSSSVTTTAASTVRFYDDAYTNYCGALWTGSGGNVVGYTVCDILEGAACGRHTIRLHTSYTTNRNGLVCHETAHALGFRHPTSSDAQDTCLANINAYNRYSAQEVSQINFIFY